MKQEAFSYTNYPSVIATRINMLIKEGWRVVAMTSIEPVGDSNQMAVVIVAERREDGPVLL